MEDYVRDLVRGTLTFEYFQERVRAGWIPVAVEWTRPATAGETQTSSDLVEPPYGFQIAEDGQHLESNPQEADVLLVMLEEIVQDHRFTQIADELNKRMFRTRYGKKWTPSAVFELLPALIDAGPSLTKSDGWASRRRTLRPALPV